MNSSSGWWPVSSVSLLRISCRTKITHAHGHQGAPVRAGGFARVFPLMGGSWEARDPTGDGHHPKATWPSGAGRQLALWDPSQTGGSEPPCRCWTGGSVPKAGGGEGSPSVFPEAQLLKPPPTQPQVGTTCPERRPEDTPWPCPWESGQPAVN